MNNIKSESRNRMLDILRALMMIYTNKKEDLQDLDRDAMAKHVVHNIWSDRHSKFWANKRYMMNIVRQR